MVQASSVEAMPYFLASASTPRMRRTAVWPSALCMAWHNAPICGPATSALRSNCSVESGVREGRSSSWMRCGRAATADVRAIVALCADQSVAPVRYCIAPERGGRSSPAERCNTPLRLPRSHPDGRYVRRTGSSEKDPAARAATMVVLRRTWPRLAVWWCRECGYQPSVPPTDPDRLALLPDSRSAALLTASSWHERPRTRPSLSDLDLSPG